LAHDTSRVPNQARRAGVRIDQRTAAPPRRFWGAARPRGRSVAGSPARKRCVGQAEALKPAQPRGMAVTPRRPLVAPLRKTGGVGTGPGQGCADLVSPAAILFPLTAHFTQSQIWWQVHPPRFGPPGPIKFTTRQSDRRGAGRGNLPSNPMSKKIIKDAVLSLLDKKPL